MGVYIKGIEIKAGTTLTVIEDENGLYLHDTRRGKCYLVQEILPHGRLIDADALGIGKANREVFDVPEYADGWNSAVKLIYDAPTVIESEE